MRARFVTPIVLTTLLAAAGGVITTVLVAPAPTPSGLAGAEEPRSAAVQHQTFADERSVEVTFQVEDDRDLVVHTGGTVTWTGCTPGSPITSGQVLLRVDERPLLALGTDVPLYRSLQAGDTGSDVGALQRELGELGYQVTADGKYGSATTRAVKKLLTAAGVVRPDGTLQLADIVWLPEHTLTPSACSATPGGPVGDGQTVATVAGALTALTYPVPADLREGRRTFTLFGVTTELDQLTGEITDGELLAQVAATADYAVAQQAQDEQKPNATLTLSEPIDALKVPPTAVFGIDGSAACVQQDDEAIPVTIVGSGLGATLVQPTDTAISLTRVALGDAVTRTDCGAELATD